MTLKVRIDRILRVVHVRVEGELTAGMMRQYLKDTWASGELEGFSELADVREVNLADLSFGKLLNLAEEAPAMRIRQKPARLALVVKSTEQRDKAEIFGAARDLLRPDVEKYKTFFSIDEAKKWLGESHAAADDPRR